MFLQRRSAANEPMYMPPGTCYVYMTYGMYHCFNISSEEPGAAVLIRALEPISGIDSMERLRGMSGNKCQNFLSSILILANKLKSGKRISKVNELCNGPSKLCIAMDITKNNSNKVDLADLQNCQMWIEDDLKLDKKNIKLIQTSRIGIPRAEEWTDKPLRYYILDNNCVSKRDKKAEQAFQINQEECSELQ